jgi:hypothetical protein
MWGPFANVFGAMAAAARGNGVAAPGSHPGNPLAADGAFPSTAAPTLAMPGAPMMMPFFHPAMGMAAGGFAWPPAMVSAATPPQTAQVHVGKTAKKASGPESSRARTKGDAPERTPPA